MGKQILIITPSVMAARGLESVLCDAGEFEVSGILRDLSPATQTRLHKLAADAIIIDPSVFDYASRANARAYLAEYSDGAVLALLTASADEESLKQYDGVISLLDDPTAVVRKVRAALENRGDAPRTEGEELSSREKEILVCVAKGMLNKEIADRFNISIYTVITHRKNITRKTGIKTVAGLTVYALLNNLIDVGDFD